MFLFHLFSSKAQNWRYPLHYVLSCRIWILLPLHTYISWLNSPNSPFLYMISKWSNAFWPGGRKTVNTNTNQNVKKIFIKKIYKSESLQYTYRVEKSRFLSSIKPNERKNWEIMVCIRKNFETSLDMFYAQSVDFTQKTYCKSTKKSFM